MLSIKNLTISVGKKKIVEDFSFDFEKNRVYALMGPNGSGKSSLALALMGHPAYRVSRNARLLFYNKSIKGLTPEKRARLGLFLSFQSPLGLTGVNALQLLRQAAGKTDVLELQSKINKIARELKIRPELLERSLNQDFSGGERKKMEILQAAVLNPKFLIFDEIDTGLDVDSLKTAASFLKRLARPDKTLLLITHYNRILKYLKPDEVLALKDGRLLAKGGYRLAQKIEKQGYEKI
jgi:Fe-S cluster assembly ATP-binding protein